MPFILFLFLFFFVQKVTASPKGKLEPPLLSSRENMQELLKWQFFPISTPIMMVKIIASSQPGSEVTYVIFRTNDV